MRGAKKTSDFGITKTHKTKIDSSVFSPPLVPSASASKINKEEIYKIAERVMKGAEVAGKKTEEVAGKARKRLKEKINKKIENEEKK